MDRKLIAEALSLAESLARESGALLMEHLGRATRVDLKGEIDPVTELDRQVESFLVGRITEKFPDHDLLAEEQASRSLGSPCRWVIDPLDGTTNYAHGYPVFTVSIALEYHGDAVIGVIYQPATREMFTSSRGGGVFLNGDPLKVTRNIDRLEDAFLVTGFPYNLREPGVLERNLSRFRRLLARSFAVRRDGSAAYDLACVAAGRFDGFWEEGLKAWDTTAGALMVREAGGVVTDLAGRDFGEGAGTILAAGSKLLHGQMLALLADEP